MTAGDIYTIAGATAPPASPRGSPMPPEHPELTAEHVLAHGGWHPRYARVLAVASDGDYGFALVDGNGDGAELEAETWLWDDGTWTGAGSSGAGTLTSLNALRAADHADDTCYAFGRTPHRTEVTLTFDGNPYQVSVNQHGVWAFVKAHTDPHSRELPELTG